MTFDQFFMTIIIFQVFQSLWEPCSRQGAYQFSKINLRPFLRHFKTDFSGI